MAAACYNPMAWGPVRSHLRGKFNIRGSLCGDCLSANLCCICTILQIKKEWEYRYGTVGVTPANEPPKSNDIEKC